MATGDQNDILGRIQGALPNKWFADSSPVRDAVLGGVSYSLALVYSLWAYTKNQTRIGTATDGFLDLISWDFFGGLLPRKANELDTPFRSRILANLLREKATRKGMIATLKTLTGRIPGIFEPALPTDTGAYGVSTSGYGVAGGYGSLLLPCQAFVTAYRPSGSGIPSIAGYGVSTAGYSVPSQGEYGSMSMIQGAVTDADIYTAIDAAKAAGTTMWSRLFS